MDSYATEDGGDERVPASKYGGAELRHLHSVTPVAGRRPDGDRAAGNLRVRGRVLHAPTNLTGLRATVDPEIVSPWPARPNVGHTGVPGQRTIRRSNV